MIFMEFFCQVIELKIYHKKKNYRIKNENKGGTAHTRDPNKYEMCANCGKV